MSVGKFALANPIIKLLASLCLSFRHQKIKKPKLISNVSLLGASGYLAACLKYTSFSSAYSSLPQFLCNHQYWYFSDLIRITFVTCQQSTKSVREANLHTQLQSHSSHTQIFLPDCLALTWDVFSGSHTLTKLGDCVPWPLTIFLIHWSIVLSSDTNSNVFEWKSARPFPHHFKTFRNTIYKACNWKSMLNNVQRTLFFEFHSLLMSKNTDRLKDVILPRSTQDEELCRALSLLSTSISCKWIPGTSTTLHFFVLLFFNNYFWVLALFVPPGSWSCSNGISQCHGTAQKAKDWFHNLSFPSIPWPSSPPLSHETGNSLQDKCRLSYI